MVNTRAFHTRVLRPRKEGKSKKTRDLKKLSRVLEISKPSVDFNPVVVNVDSDDVDVDVDGDDNGDAACCSTNDDLEMNCDELGFRSTKDMVWGKAYPYIWWPGWIRRESRGKFLVSFFRCERTLWFYRSQIRSFEADFEMLMSKKVGGQRLEPDVIDCALAEFSRRLMLELTCSCRDNENDTKERKRLDGKTKVELNEVFEPVEALGFVQNIAVSPSFDEIDSVGVIRAVVQVNAFRRYAFIKRDWIYGKTMGIFESVGDLDANKKSTCFEDRGIRPVLEFTEEEVEEVKEEEEEEVIEEDEVEMKKEVHEKEEKEDVEEENEEENGREFVEQVKIGSIIYNKNSSEPLGQQYLIEVEENEGVEKDKEEEVEKEEETNKEDREKEKKEDKEEESPGEFVEQVKSGPGICNNSKDPLEQQYLIERPQSTVKKVLNPLEALTFVRRIAVSSWVDDIDAVDVSRAAAQMNTFRSYAYIKHDWIYRKTMRLSVSSDESEVNKKTAFSEDELTFKVIPEVEFSVEEENNRQALFVERMRSDSVICKNPLRDILKHLWCLALDPFYSGAEGHGPKNFDATCQKILRYRELLYQKVPNLSPRLRHTSHHDFLDETSRVQEPSKASSTLHLSYRPVNISVEENVGVTNVDGTQESEYLSEIWSQLKRKARVKRKSEDAKVCCSGSNANSIVEPVDSEVVDLLMENADCKSVSENDKTQKTEDVKVCRSISNVQVRGFHDLKTDIPDFNGESKRNKRQKTEDAKVSIATNVENGDVVDLPRGPLDCSRVSGSNKRNKTDYVKVHRSIGNVDGGNVDHQRATPNFDRSESKKRQKVSAFGSDFRFQEGIAKTLDGYISAQPCNEAVIDGTRVDLKVDCRSKCKLTSEQITGTQCEDKVGVASSKCSLLAQLFPNNVDLYPNARAAADLSKKEHSIRTVSGGSYEGNGRLHQHSIDISVKFQQAKTPLTMLYSSPLSAASPSSSGNTQLQSSNTHTHSGHPTTLHMKFPKDFKLPSKDELVKQFRPFGPIDYLKTKVFFYTGSAQLVFSNHLDAEAACNHAKSKNMFLGGANVRFWLDKHEHSRRGSNTISAPLSLPTPESSKTNLKSCLRISKPQRNKVERKQLHVKFPSANQDLPCATIQTKHTVFTESDSCKYSRKVGPEISPQMLVLLEKCDQMVTTIKASLGLQSYYSLFTHNG